MARGGGVSGVVAVDDVAGGYVGVVLDGVAQLHHHLESVLLEE